VRLIPPTGDTTSLIPIIDDGFAHEDVELDGAPAKLEPGTALLVLTRGFDADTRYVLDKPETTVGRSADCDILLDDITVSRKHATFVLADDGVTVQDHGSLNGTYVNRELVDGSRTLKQGDEVQIGKFRMKLFANERGGS